MLEYIRRFLAIVIVLVATPMALTTCIICALMDHPNGRGFKANFLTIWGDGGWGAGESSK